MNSLQSTLREGRQFVFQVPADAPLPQFDMFQRVTWRGYGGDVKGTIIGLYWVDDSTALMEHIAPGWHYQVSRIYGVTDVRKILERGSEQTPLSESKLSAVVDHAFGGLADGCL
ncbi:MAG: hypothetical protein ACFB0G_11360 [Leptolyngbyaceae cyanobacterium]